MRTNMPINRPDGRHWCAPERESTESSPWPCPECGKEWEFDPATQAWTEKQEEESES